MSKQNIFTVMGIVLSFLIAIGGWILISRLMDVQSDMLMSATGTSPIAMPLQLPQADDIAAGENADEAVYAHSLLSEQDIVSIIRNLESSGHAVPHEPTPEQITMGQAIMAGENWLSFIGEQLNFPDRETLFAFDRTSSVFAYLSQNQQQDRSAFLPPTYSFWTVTFINRYINAVMLINAVDGQVWQASFSSSDPLLAFEVSFEDVSNMLTAFVTIVGIDIYVDETREVMDGALFKDFANESAYAMVRVAGTPLDWESDRWLIRGFCMFLGTYEQLVIAPAPPFDVDADRETE